MGKKAVRVAISNTEDLVRKNAEDKVINDLMEKRKLQQDALLKIITAMDKVLPLSDLGSSSDSEKKNFKKRPKK
jgi:hypothetical protein